MKPLDFMPAIYFDPDGGGSGSTTDPAAGEGEGEKPQSFTQAQLNNLFAERAKSAASAREKELLDKTGATSVDELTALIAEAKQARESQATEAEKQAAALKAAEDKAAKAETEKTDALAKAARRLMDAEILIEAKEAGFLPEAIADVLLVVDRSKIIEKDGKFEGVKEAVKAVAEAKKFWLAAQRPENKFGTPPRKQAGGQPPDTNQNKQPEKPLIRL